MLSVKEVGKIQCRLIELLSNDVKTIQLQVTHGIDNDVCCKILDKFDERWKTARKKY